jgi:glycosyltransferase involved in cell wall biosynthesis
MNLRGKYVIISVISDLVTDQRVHRTALTVRQQGAEVVLVGRSMKGSLAMHSRGYRFKRFKLWVEKGPLFYAFYNIRLFVYLLFSRCDLLIANDLDTLPANFLISRIRRIPLVYDTHEYFTEVPELVNRPRIRKLWKAIERRIFPRLKTVITVNDSIAGLYQEEYGVAVAVVRNIPLSDPFSAPMDQLPERNAFGLPDDTFIFILQGSGINMHRGAEEAVEAMLQIDHALLLIVGGGDVIPKLKATVDVLCLQEKVRFISKMPLQQLRKITRLADAGLTLDRDTNLNYRFSLPNKLFDYIHAEIPVLATDLPEVSAIVRGYEIGDIVPELTASSLAAAMKEMMDDKSRLARWKQNLTFAAGELTWEKESRRLLDVLHAVHG